MRSRIVFSSFVAFILAIGLLTPLTVGNTLNGDATASASTVNASPPGGSGGSTQGGNSFTRALTAPFRALARLFGGGKKKDKAESVAKDAKKIESTAETKPAAGVTATAVEARPETNAAVGEAPAAGVRPPESAPRRARSMPSPSVEKDKRLPESAALPGGTSGTYPPGVWKPVIEGAGPDSLSQGRALLENGYLNEAIAELSIAASVGPNLLEANNLLGFAYDRRGLHKQAIECYERALRAAPKDARTLNNLGYSLYMDDNYRPALDRLKQAARLIPNDPRILNNLGLVQCRVGKFDDAFKSFARAGDEYTARLKVAEQLQIVGRDTEAIKHYTAALRLQPASPVALEKLADLYQRTGRISEAEAMRRALDKAAPKPGNKSTTATGGGGGGI